MHSTSSHTLIKGRVPLYIKLKVSNINSGAADVVDTTKTLIDVIDPLARMELVIKIPSV